jgi:Mg2+-importing ATPase
VATCVPSGISSQDAQRRLLDVGPNDPAPVHRLSAVPQFLRLLANPLVIVLIAAASISAALGRPVDALIIVVIVLLSTTVDFWQSYRSQAAIDRLRASVAPTATVQRDGVWQEVPIHGVVPDDLVRLSAGDLVPADARVVEARGLTVDQAMLTGESLPVSKGPLPAPSTVRDPAAPDLVFLGTSVVSGTATAVVIATGRRTAFGDIAARLAMRAPETEFERGLRRFSGLILRTTMALVLLVLLGAIALGRHPLEWLLFAVALGVGLTPEFLPMIASITLANGAVRMARHGVIVKRLPAIQNLGAIDILCVDKTGTLTGGRMHIAQEIDAIGLPSARPLALAALNSRFETGIRSPLDAAILARAPDVPAGVRKIDEIPFDFERRLLSIVVERADEGDRLLVAKGAPEALLPLCATMEGESGLQPLDADRRALTTAAHERLSADGLRVLAIAWRQLPAAPAYGRDEERDLVLAGYLAFADPVLPDAAHVLSRLAADGVAVKVLTGDGELVARTVCREVGLAIARLVTGDELTRLGDTALSAVAEQAQVFVRVSPAQKNRIILALRRRGHVVGFLGDGINDAPSLHSADVGISVQNAADVARQAADIVLGQRSLRVLHRGIVEGRRASGNMMKYLLMGTSSNFGNMFSMAVASVWLPFLPMLPTEILLNNFLYDLAQVAIPTDAVDREYVRRPQRWDVRLVRNFMLAVGPVSSIFDFLTFAVLLYVFHADERLFHSGWFVESLATQTLVVFIIRTVGSPLASRPGRALTLTILAVVAAGTLLPFSPVGPALGFEPLSPAYFVFLGVATLAYLSAVELVKRRVIRGAF